MGIIRGEACHDRRHAKVRQTNMVSGTMSAFVPPDQRGWGRNALKLCSFIAAGYVLCCLISWAKNQFVAVLTAFEGFDAATCCTTPHIIEFSLVSLAMWVPLHGLRVQVIRARAAPRAALLGHPALVLHRPAVPEVQRVVYPEQRAPSPVPVQAHPCMGPRVVQGDIQQIYQTNALSAVAGTALVLFLPDVGPVSCKHAAVYSGTAVHSGRAEMEGLLAGCDHIQMDSLHMFHCDRNGGFFAGQRAGTRRGCRWGRGLLAESSGCCRLACADRCSVWLHGHSDEERDQNDGYGLR